jgi:hypothetical protein
MVEVARPDITALALFYLIAARAILSGVFEVVAAIDPRKQIDGEWLLGTDDQPQTNQEEEGSACYDEGTGIDQRLPDIGRVGASRRRSA